MSLKLPSHYTRMTGIDAFVGYFPSADDRRFIHQASFSLVERGILDLAASAFDMAPFGSGVEIQRGAAVVLDLSRMLTFGWRQDSFQLLRTGDLVAPVPGTMRHSHANQQLWLDDTGAGWLSDASRHILLASEGTSVGNTVGAVLYAVPWMREETPLLLTPSGSNTGTMVHNYDFVRAGNALLFRTRPAVHEMTAVLQCARPTSFSYAVSQCAPQHFGVLSALYKDEVTVPVLSRALCVVLGVDWWTAQATVTDVDRLSEQHCRVWLNDVPRVVRTDKTPVVGAVVNPDTPVDGSFSLLNASQAAALDWSKGAQCSAWTPFSHIPAGVHRCTSLTESGKPALRVGIGTTEQQDAFISHLVRTSSGQALWDYCGFTAAGQTQFVDVLRLLFEALGDWAIVLSHDPGRVSQDAMAFLRRHMPCRSTLIIHERP